MDQAPRAAATSSMAHLAPSLDTVSSQEPREASRPGMSPPAPGSGVMLPRANSPSPMRTLPFGRGLPRATDATPMGFGCFMAGWGQLSPSPGAIPGGDW